MNVCVYVCMCNHCTGLKFSLIATKYGTQLGLERNEDGLCGSHCGNVFLPNFKIPHESQNLGYWDSIEAEVLTSKN